MGLEPLKTTPYWEEKSTDVILSDEEVVKCPQYKSLRGIDLLSQNEFAADRRKKIVGERSGNQRNAARWYPGTPSITFSPFIFVRLLFLAIYSSFVSV